MAPKKINKSVLKSLDETSSDSSDSDNQPKKNRMFKKKLPSKIKKSSSDSSDKENQSSERDKQNNSDSSEENEQNNSNSEESDNSGDEQRNKEFKEFLKWKKNKNNSNKKPVEIITPKKTVFERKKEKISFPSLEETLNGLTERDNNQAETLINNTPVKEKNQKEIINSSNSTSKQKTQPFEPNKIPQIPINLELETSNTQKECLQDSGTALPEGQPNEQYAALPKGQPNEQSVALPKGQPNEQYAALPKGQPATNATVPKDSNPLAEKNQESIKIIDKTTNANNKLINSQELNQSTKLPESVNPDNKTHETHSNTEGSFGKELTNSSSKKNEKKNDINDKKFAEEKTPSVFVTPAKNKSKKSKKDNFDENFKKSDNKKEGAKEKAKKILKDALSDSDTEEPSKTDKNILENKIKNKENQNSNNNENEFIIPNISLIVFVSIITLVIPYLQENYNFPINQHYFSLISFCGFLYNRVNFITLISIMSLYLFIHTYIGFYYLIGLIFIAIMCGSLIWFSTKLINLIVNIYENIIPEQISTPLNLIITAIGLIVNLIKSVLVNDVTKSVDKFISQNLLKFYESIRGNKIISGVESASSTMSGYRNTYESASSFSRMTVGATPFEILTGQKSIPDSVMKEIPGLLGGMFGQEKPGFRKKPRGQINKKIKDAMNKAKKPETNLNDLM